MSEIIGIVVTCIAVYGAWLNIKMVRYGFLLWVVSDILSIGLHVHAGMWGMAVRDVIFLGLAFHGYYKWTKSDSMLTAAFTEIEKRSKRKKRQKRSR